MDRDGGWSTHDFLTLSTQRSIFSKNLCFSCFFRVCDGQSQGPIFFLSESHMMSAYVSFGPIFGPIGKKTGTDDAREGRFLLRVNGSHDNPVRSRSAPYLLLCLVASQACLAIRKPFFLQSAC